MYALGKRQKGSSCCSGINKPVAVRDWLEKAQPTEEFIFIIDSDTIMREGFNVEEVGLRPGIVNPFYPYKWLLENNADLLLSRERQDLRPSIKMPDVCLKFMAPFCLQPDCACYPTNSKQSIKLNAARWLIKSIPKKQSLLFCNHQDHFLFRAVLHEIDHYLSWRNRFNKFTLKCCVGWAISGYYGYLKGVNNELATKHIPEVPPRNDTLAGPRYRKSDQVKRYRIPLVLSHYFKRLALVLSLTIRHLRAFHKASR